ncbi:MAG TPA: adenylate/guanylate cyclase domain-containing protein [Gemmataceae bacterium]|nr:adenylate/guanylate cyclase domain-containing protein [Gemmataceae bacterium]
MGWDEQRSRERVRSNDFHDFAVDVQDLRRTMDFSNLGKKDVRRAEGVHLYVDVPNFHRAVDDAGNDQQKQRKLVRAASVLRKAQGELLEQDDIGDIQRQTVRLHALAYKPYDGDEESREADRVERAVIHAITHNTYVLDVFNKVFNDVRDFDSAVGLASGTSYIANIGKHGDRELISLGSCANLAAKILDGRDTITVTKVMYYLLPDFLQAHFDKASVVAGVQTYQSMGLRWSRFPELAEDLGVTWSEEKWRKRTEQHRDELPLHEIEISDATSQIDVNGLTERNCKRTAAVAVYADLDGFTRYVQEAETNDKIVSLIRQFNMIRAEFHAVVGSDYDGLVVQHRGDCILAILHLPSGDDKHAKRCQKAVDIAIGLQSSMEHVLNEHLNDRKEIHVAVGLDEGKAFLTRLGKKGRRVSICFGPEVSTAENLQMRTGPKGIRISEAIYQQLNDEDVEKEFSDDGDTYVATGLTFPKLDRIKEEKAARAGTLGAVVREGRVIVTSAAALQTGPWHTSKPWGLH